MLVAIAIIGSAAAILGIAWWLSYNRFVRQRQLVANSWSNVETELTRRYDLIPNLVSTVKGYAAHERDTLEAVIQARTGAVGNTGGAAAQAQDENQFVGALRQLLALREDYPDLKADAHFLELQHELAITEDRIQAARRFYNANVRDLNTRVESFPSMLVAKAGGFEQADFFEIDAAVRDAGTPEVRLS